MLKSAGIRNYAIWSDGETVFSYCKCEKGIAFAQQAQAGSPVVGRWNEYMQPVRELDMDCDRGAAETAASVFAGIGEKCR